MCRENSEDPAKLETVEEQPQHSEESGAKEEEKKEGESKEDSTDET